MGGVALMRLGPCVAEEFSENVYGRTLETVPGWDGPRRIADIKAEAVEQRG